MPPENHEGDGEDERLECPGTGSVSQLVTTDTARGLRTRAAPLGVSDLSEANSRRGREQQQPTGNRGTDSRKRLPKLSSRRTIIAAAETSLRHIGEPDDESRASGGGDRHGRGRVLPAAAVLGGAGRRLDQHRERSLRDRDFCSSTSRDPAAASSAGERRHQ